MREAKEIFTTEASDFCKQTKLILMPFSLCFAGWLLLSFLAQYTKEIIYFSLTSVENPGWRNERKAIFGAVLWRLISSANSTFSAWRSRFFPSAVLRLCFSCSLLAENWCRKSSMNQALQIEATSPIWFRSLCFTESSETKIGVLVNGCRPKGK